MDKDCIQLTLYAILWGAAAIIAVVGIYYQARARVFFRPPSLMERLTLMARFRLSNFAPEGARFVVRGRIAAFVFLCVVVGALALGQAGFVAGAAAC